MQNENAGKTTEQIAAEEYPFLESKKTDSEDWKMHCDSVNRKVMIQRVSFIDGYTTAQQSQPMWREIDAKVRYYNVMVRLGNDTEMYHESTGKSLLAIGYTHYLSSEDLLKLPTLTKTTPQERG